MGDQRDWVALQARVFATLRSSGYLRPDGPLSERDVDDLADSLADDIYAMFDLTPREPGVGSRGDELRRGWRSPLGRRTRSPDRDEMVLISSSMVRNDERALFVIRNFDDLFMCLSLTHDGEEAVAVHAHDAPDLLDAIAALGPMRRGQVVWRPRTDSAWRSYRFGRVDELDAWLEGQPVPLLPQLARPS